MRRILVALGLSTAFAALSVACTSAEESTDSRADEVRIKPDGSDLPGKLLIVAPARATGVEPTTIDWASTRTVKLGEVLDDLPVGEVFLTMWTRGESFSSSAPVKVIIASGQTTTVTTALLGVESVGGPRTLGVGEFRQSMGISVRPYGSNVKVTSDGKLMPLIEGDYEVSFGLNSVDGVPAKLRSGETKIVTLTDTTARRVTRLRAPIRELPDAKCSGARSPRAWTVSLTDEWPGSGEHAFILNDGEALDVGISPKNEGAGYQLRNQAWTRRYDVPLGKRGAGPKIWQIGRIDVDHVSVNGGPANVKGTYQVWPADATGARAGAELLACTPPTNTGVDMPPGHYRVEVDYKTVEAGEKTDVHIIDVP